MPHGAHPGHEGVAADRGEMMHAHHARKPGVVVDVDVSAQQRAVGHHDVVAQLTVVGHVAAAHQVVVAAQPGHPSSFSLARLIVTHSRMTLSSPMTTRVFEPR